MKDEIERSIKRSVKDQFYRIKLCPMLSRPGGCTKGDHCSYAHDSQQIAVPVSLRKTKICKQWRLGTCHDMQCKYAHGEHELRSTLSFYKTSLCKYYANGSCPQGELCRHAHGENELKQQTVVCHKGNAPVSAKRILGRIASPSKDDIRVRENTDTTTTSEGSCSDETETFTTKTLPSQTLSSEMLTPELNSTLGDDTPLNDFGSALMLPPTKLRFNEPTYVQTIQWLNQCGIVTSNMIAESFASFYEE